MSDPARVTVREAVETLGLTVLAYEEGLDREITGAIACDLLSYVMGAAKQGHLWFTVQTHTNIVAVAQLAQASAIVVTSGFAPDPDTVARAEEEEITLLSSPEPSYPLAGRLHGMGVR